MTLTTLLVRHQLSSTTETGLSLADPRGAKGRRQIVM
jgi:hypothetical protein